MAYCVYLIGTLCLKNTEKGSNKPRTSNGWHATTLARQASTCVLVILDGVADIPATRKRMPDDVADNVVQLTRQKPSAGSLENEVCPFGDAW